MRQKDRLSIVVMLKNSNAIACNSIQKKIAYEVIFTVRGQVIK